MELDVWMKYIVRALKNKDPHIRWMFIPSSCYSYSIYVTGEVEGILFVEGTKDHIEYVEAEEEVSKMLGKREPPKEMYS